MAVRTGGHSFDEEVSEAAVRPPRVPATSLARVRVSGNLSAIDREFIFRGRLTGTFEQPCDRCLEPARAAVDQDVTWLFEAAGETARVAGAAGEDAIEFEAGDVDERARYISGEEIDLGPHVWEEMVLAAPAKYYCRADCRGLCPKCGTNLNAGACECAAEEEETANTGLAALKELYPNLPSKPLEE
jgi:uncharacterized protein